MEQMTCPHPDLRRWRIMSIVASANSDESTRTTVSLLPSTTTNPYYPRICMAPLSGGCPAPLTQQCRNPNRCVAAFDVVRKVLMSFVF